MIGQPRYHFEVELAGSFPVLNGLFMACAF
jgi:hypothetical protein